MRGPRRVTRATIALLAATGVVGCLTATPPKTPNQRAVERAERPVPAPSPPREAPPRPAR